MIKLIGGVICPFILDYITLHYREPDHEPEWDPAPKIPHVWVPWRIYLKLKEVLWYAVLKKCAFPRTDISFKHVTMLTILALFAPLFLHICSLPAPGCCSLCIITIWLAFPSALFRSSSLRMIIPGLHRWTCSVSIPLQLFYSLYSVRFQEQLLFQFLLHALIVNTFTLFSSKIIIHHWIIGQKQKCRILSTTFAHLIT